MRWRRIGTWRTESRSSCSFALASENSYTHKLVLYIQTERCCIDAQAACGAEKVPGVADQTRAAIGRRIGHQAVVGCSIAVMMQSRDKR